MYVEDPTGCSLVRPMGAKAMPPSMKADFYTIVAL